MKPFHKIEDFSIKSYQAFLHITFVFNGCDPSKLGSTPDVKKFGFEFFFFFRTTSFCGTAKQLLFSRTGDFGRISQT